MKKLFLGLMLSVFSLAASFAQVDNYADYSSYGDHTGYDGDFFSLEGAIDVFKQSNSIQDFERKLNREDTWVNNLDLNQDGQIDYIRVEHRRQGDFHAIILQVPINRRDVQDIAVIEIEKTGRRRAMLQIIGDADLYGEEVIVEPFEGVGYSNGRGGPNADYDFRRGYVNVYYWSAVRNMFRRDYRIYASPYRWNYYPTYWSPWRPCAWNVFRPRIVIYQRNYHVVYVHRLIRVHNFYRPYRAACPAVYQRTSVVRKSGRKSNYSRVSQERIRSNKNVRNGNGNAKVNNRNAAATRTSKSKVKSNSRTTQRVGKSTTRATAPKVNRSDRGTRKNTTRNTPQVKQKKQRSSSIQRSTRTTTKQRSTSTYRKPSTRSTPSAKRKSTATRSTPSRKSATRSSTKKTASKATRKTSTSKSRKRN